ncbi:MAG: glycosyltransferase [Patescibacteria group bacterium]|nr:glycosyltransferase [Patescibacteria group bacterium]
MIIDHKKVLFLTNDLNLQKGGQELVSKYLIEVFGETNKLFICNQKFFLEGNHYGYIKSDWEIDFTRKGFIRGIIELVSKLRKISKKQSFNEVVISATPFSTLLYFFFIKMYFLFKRSKFVHWCHVDPLSSLFLGSRIPFVLYPLGLLLYRKFDKIVATNPDMAEKFRKFYFVPKKKITIITLPIRPDFKKLISEKINFNFSKPVIITVTRLTTVQKDPVTLLKAFTLVKEKFPKASLLFLGDGPEKEKLKKIAKELRIEKNTQFLGFVKNPLAYLRRSDVFVLSSKSEGTSVSLVEAQACGIPIVATDCPVGPKWILKNGKAGILVKVGDWEDMGKKIIKLLSNKSLAKKLAQEGLKASSRFSYDNFKKKWLRLVA